MGYGEYMIKYSVKTGSPEETEAVGFELARKMCTEWLGNRFIALYGDLGVGKTAFVRGAARFLAPGAVVTSPTYSIVNEYNPTDEVGTEISSGASNKATLFHFDMYRITDEDSLDSIDFDSYFMRGAFIITEWSENIEFALPDNYVKVKIERVSENERLISVDEIKN